MNITLNPKLRQYASRPVPIISFFLAILILANLYYHTNQHHINLLQPQDPSPPQDSPVQSDIDGIYSELSSPSYIDELRQDLITNKQKEIIDQLKLDLVNDQLSDSEIKLYNKIKQEIAVEAKLVAQLEQEKQDEEHQKHQQTQQEINLIRTEYFKQIYANLFTRNKPSSEPLTADERGSDVGCHMYKNPLSPPWSIKELLKDKVNIPHSKFLDLQSSHENLVNDIKKLKFPEQVFNGTGIVINGGGIYFGSALIVVRQLRELGSKLPIELIIDNEYEYDEDICEEVLPKLNTRCLVMERVLGTELHQQLALKKFELKVMGIFLSTFDDILLLDADNIPIINPDHLFDSDLYKESNFFMWPDIWHRATSPLFYNIAGIEIGEPIRRDQLNNEFGKIKDRDEMAMHDLSGLPPSLTVESGQMLLSKSTHYKSFLLSVYYNMYGYSYYYRLLFQGSCGEGDKETFIPALHAFNEPYHLNQYPSWLAGYDNNGAFQESTIIQYDIIDSNNYLHKMKKWLITKKIDSRINLSQDNQYTRSLHDQFRKETDTQKPLVMFLHMNNPKPNPFKNDESTYAKRHLGEIGAYKEHWTKDWELKVFTISKWVACEAVKSDMIWKKVGKPQTEACEQVSKYVEFLKSTTNDLSASELSDF